MKFQISRRNLYGYVNRYYEKRIPRGMTKFLKRIFEQDKGVSKKIRKDLKI